MFFCIQIFTLYKDTSHIGLELTLMTSSWFNLQRHCFLISYILGYWGLEPQHRNLGGGHDSAHNTHRVKPQLSEVSLV